MARGHFLVCMLILGIGILLWAVNLDAQPEDILLDDQSVFTNPSRSPVAFPHMQHIDAGIECTDCHHRFKGGENVLDEGELEEGAAGIKCPACHKNNTGFRFKPDLDPTKRTLRQAYHRMCIGCHRQLSRDKKKQLGPVTCGECHPRKKKPEA
jgi:c(7)-type cytochrome triheme protein